MPENIFDPSLNVLQPQNPQLDTFFKPQTVAVIGATEKEGSVGKTLLSNLLNKSFKGEVFPVNPKRETVLGVKAYPSIDKVPKEVDLAVIATPAKTVPALIKECVKAKVKTAIIISAGFKEIGQVGINLEKEIMKNAEGKLRIVGPNCLGIMNPLNGLNATFAAEMALEGNIAFISQSGALCTAVLDWSLKEKVGFSSFVSIGSMVDVNWGDLINYFGQDPNTQSILIYMESIKNPRSFLSAAREVALTKPIILIKAGKTLESAKAAASHTGALVGSDAVLNAALNRIGVLRVETISDLFNMAEILAKQPRPKGPYLSIITNAGGPGVIATDVLMQSSGKLTGLTDDIKKQLDAFLPSAWSHNNPIDILGDASAERYAQTLKVMVKDPYSQGVLVILTPQYMTDATKVAEILKDCVKDSDKPILASWMGADKVEKGISKLKEAGIPNFEFPDSACRTFGYMWSYSYNINGIYEIPPLRDELSDNAAELAKQKTVSQFFSQARKEKRTVLSEYESKTILDAFEIPIAPTYTVTTVEEAVTQAEKIGFPIVLKLYSKTITHKSDVGGVKLNLNNAEAVKQAYAEIKKSVTEKAGKEHFQGVSVQPMIDISGGYELILGSSVDPQFGPVILFGSGGVLVEVFEDSALALPPLNATLAKRLMKKTKIYKALKGVRGRKSVDLNYLSTILIRFSRLIAECPIIKECDINPLWVSADKIYALDARIVLHEEDNNLPELAIRPYPTQYIKFLTLKDDLPITLRPIMPEDEPLLVDFLKTLSDKAIYYRFLREISSDELLNRDQLIRACFCDYDRQISIVAEKKDAQKKREILAVARLIKKPEAKEAFFSLVVKDKWQQKGIASALLKQLIEIAKAEKLTTLSVCMFAENQPMQKLCQKMGFVFKPSKDKKRVLASLKL